MRQRHRFFEYGFEPLLFLIIVIALIVPVFKIQALTVSPIRIELEGNPGETVKGELTLSNESDGFQTFYTVSQNFEARGESGAPNFVTGTEGLATWITAPENLDLKPNEYRERIPFEIKIPMEAEPGGHFAAIFWTTNPPSDIESGVAIGVKVGTLILLRVSGDIEEGGGIIEFSTIDKQKIYLHRPINFFYRFRNDGADRIKPDGTANIRNLLGIRSDSLPPNSIEGNILPDSIRLFEFTWEGRGLSQKEPTNWFSVFWLNVNNEWHNFGIGRYSVKLSLDYGADKQLHSEAKYVFWILPWHLSLVAIIILIILYFVGRREILSYNEWIVRRTIKHMNQLKEAARRYGGKKKV
ncbi:MAG: hypothetical protein UV08_C0036G0002 [Parcubacteria group bacterium GW2011_GWA2_42_18]|nr:MAG: hypothetical protein UV08_C0036G0002 [Parcubacteria group bacterium GW2011_GWA2_42_18]